MNEKTGTAPTPMRPAYRKVYNEASGETPTFLIVCDEGWRESIVCGGMYEWAADWLIKQIQGRPYAPERVPCPQTTKEMATE